MGEADGAAGRAGAVVGARDGLGVPRRHAGLSGRRGRASHRPGRRSGPSSRRRSPQPLGADFHIGLAPEHDARVARVIPPANALPSWLDAPTIAARTMANPPIRAEASWTAAWRRAEMPAWNGHGNARSIATIQSRARLRRRARRDAPAVGTRVRGRVRRAGERPRPRPRCPLRFGMGYGLTSHLTPLGPNPRTFLGRVGRLAGRRRPRRAPGRRLRHESHGRGHARRRARRVAGSGDVREPRGRVTTMTVLRVVAVGFALVAMVGRDIAPGATAVRSPSGWMTC